VLLLLMMMMMICDVGTGGRQPRGAR